MTPNCKLLLDPVALLIVCYGDGNWGIILAMEFIQVNSKKSKSSVF